MEAYTWPFAQSFLVFLCIVFFSEAVSTRLRSLLPMPLLFGVLFAAGFAFGVLPRDLLLSSNMVHVGTIAFHVLIIHSGTMISFRNLAKKKKEAALTGLSVLLMTGVLIPVMWQAAGREYALLSPGAVVGGGASCAIGARWVSEKNPAISFYPWIIFMFQGVFSVPAVSWAIKKEVIRLGSRLPASRQTQEPAALDGKKGLADLIGPEYKTTAWYLGCIMVLTVLNQVLQGTILKNAGINPNITALILGMLAGNLSLIDRAPLFRSDAYGLLILSLMGLMANNLANTPLPVLLSLAGPALLALALGSAVLTVCGFFFGKRSGIGPYAGVILTMNSVMGFPVNRLLVRQAVQSLPEEIRPAAGEELLSHLNLGTSLISNGLSVLMIGVLVALI